MLRRTLLTSAAASATLVVQLSFPSVVLAHDCVGEMHYTAEGKIELRLGTNFARRTGLSVEPMNDIEVRLRRDNRPGSELTSNTVSTDQNGNFKAHGCFARDTNGILGGGNPIEITVQARFRSDRLKLRNANMIDSNWHDIHRYTDRDGGNRDVGTITYNELNIIDGEFDTFAEIWWLYSRELDRFQKRGVGFDKRISVTYPHNSVFYPDTTAHVIGKNNYLGSDDGPDDWDEPLVMLHEIMHSYHALRLDGNAAPGCLMDAHHQAPSNWRSSRCSGFMEGLAEAGARYLLDKHYGLSTEASVPQTEALVTPASTSEMRNPTAAGGSLVTGFAVRTMDDAERTDAGWLNFFLYLFTENEWSPNGLAPRNPCSSAMDVKLFQLLRALEAESLAMSSVTFRDVLRILERQIDGFDRRDSDIYEMVANPANANVSAMQARIDDEFCKLEAVQAGRNSASVRANSADGRLQQVSRP